VRGECILPSAIVDYFRNGNGTVVILTEGSTQPVTAIVQHAGITKVKRYAFTLV
jgi:hypothetical protein